MTGEHGESKGYCFVTFSTLEEAKQAPCCVPEPAKLGGEGSTHVGRSSVRPVNYRCWVWHILRGQPILRGPYVYSTWPVPCAQGELTGSDLVLLNLVRFGVPIWASKQKASPHFLFPPLLLVVG